MNRLKAQSQSLSVRVVLPAPLLRRSCLWIWYREEPSRVDCSGALSAFGEQPAQRLVGAADARPPAVLQPGLDVVGVFRQIQHDDLKSPGQSALRVVLGAGPGLKRRVEE